ncbi:hypothetical protein HYR69_10715, partial [Candidatus Sumerlaeota bacterium]|nr:hypothetical protein [Candidatus Sumerlaeota bacterium]
MAGKIPNFTLRLRFVYLPALAHASLAVLLLAGAIVVGSASLRNFDPGLAHYALSSLVALFAVVYRLSIWLSRPPTSRLFRRAAMNVIESRKARKRARVGRETRRPGFLSTILRRLAGAFVAQDFIRRRGFVRWAAHAGLSYGSLLAFAFTFPLVFGWVHFETPDDPQIYHLHVFGFDLDRFRVDSLKAILAFNLLNISAVMVLIGAALAAWRRVRDRGERAVQTFREDWMPLLLLVAVSATGLMMTANTHLAGGNGYVFAGTAHAVSVIALLMFIPFGKLFHMFQRTAALAVAINKKAALAVAPARCHSCDAPFASAAQVEDLHTVLAELGLLPVFSGAAGSVPYTQICPPCRRRL